MRIENHIQRITILAGYLLLAACAGTADTTAERRTIRHEGDYVAYSDGTVTDTKARLMWAAVDNGDPIDWGAAERYCADYRGGGHADWRLPTAKELLRLYRVDLAGPRGQPGYRITPLVQLTGSNLWSSTDVVSADASGGKPAMLYVKFSNETGAGELLVGYKNPVDAMNSSDWQRYRVLPVRTPQPDEQ